MPTQNGKELSPNEVRKKHLFLGILDDYFPAIISLQRLMGAKNDNVHGFEPLCSLFPDILSRERILTCPSLVLSNGHYPLFAP